MRSGEIVLQGDSKNLTDKDLERAYFGFEEGARKEQAHFETAWSCPRAGLFATPIDRHRAGRLRIDQSGSLVEIDAMARIA